MGLTAKGIVNKLPFGKYAAAAPPPPITAATTSIVRVVSSAKTYFELSRLVFSVFHRL